MNSERPDTLLKSALEKIIYFEARSEQLSNDLSAARAEAMRFRNELALAAQREIELRRSVAEHEVQIRRGHQEREELSQVIEALKAERAELIGKLIEASRIHSSGSAEADESFDLASFIAQLRSEAIAQRPLVTAPVAVGAKSSGNFNPAPVSARWSPPPPPPSPAPAFFPATSSGTRTVAAAARPPPTEKESLEPALALASEAPTSEAEPTLASEESNLQSSSAAPEPSVPEQPQPEERPARAEKEGQSASFAMSSAMEHAERLLSEGRLGVSAEQLEELAGPRSFSGRTEETLFGFSVRELAAPEPAARARAAERLKALAQPAAAAPLASALLSEEDPQVVVAMLATFASLAKSEGAQVVRKHLEAKVPEVRIAALKALLALEPASAGPYLSAAMRDPDPSVRRRASLLALGLPPQSALKLGEQALGDSNPDVRRLGALALGATGGERAKFLLLQAVRDREPKVRQVAAQSLSRILGHDVSSLVDLDDIQRRREVRRLSSNGQPISVAPARSRDSAEPASPPASARAATKAAPTAAPARTAASAAPKAAAKPRAPAAALDEALCNALVFEVRCAIRGRTLGELTASSDAAPKAVEAACELLVARGQFVRRGKKFFVA